MLRIFWGKGKKAAPQLPTKAQVQLLLHRYSTLLTLATFKDILVSPQQGEKNQKENIMPREVVCFQPKV